MINTHSAEFRQSYKFYGLIFSSGGSCITDAMKDVFVPSYVCIILILAC